MDKLELLQRLSVALAIGLLIGLERGWQARAEPEGERSAGLRTHTLAAILGGLWGAVAATRGDGGAVALGLAFMAFSAGMIVFRFHEIRHDKTYGATTLVASMLAFALGAFAMLGDMQVAAATGVAVTALLALKAGLHAWLRRLTWLELRSGLVVLAMTCIVLPLLPDRAVDRWDVINPFAIWLMTVMIAVISFGGYVAVKVMGERSGIIVSAIAGGLASSTAVTLNLSRLAREQNEQSGILAAGILISGATMMVRTLLVATVINTAMLTKLAMPIGAAGAALAGGGALMVWRHAANSSRQQPLKLDNPLDLPSVLKFGLLLMVVTVLVKLSTALAGDAGAYAIAALSGIADVDAITLSMARTAGDQIGTGAASLAILIAVLVNTFSKTALAWSVGGTGLGWRLLVVSVIAGGAALFGALASA
jgi:uncharacterized membrane protein (DUF4010 family)